MNAIAGVCIVKCLNLRIQKADQLKATKDSNKIQRTHFDT